MEEVGTREISIQIGDPVNDPQNDGMGRQQVRMRGDLVIQIKSPENDPPGRERYQVQGELKISNDPLIDRRKYQVQGELGFQPKNPEKDPPIEGRGRNRVEGELETQTGNHENELPRGCCQVRGELEIQFENPETNPPIDCKGGYRVQGQVEGELEIQSQNSRRKYPVQGKLKIHVDAETIERRLKLYKAAITGDWTTAEEIYNGNREEANRPIANLDQTALHIATLAEKTKFVSKLVGKMDEKGLTHRDTQDNTALCLAAITGKKKLAAAILDQMQELTNLEKRRTLAMIRGRDGMLPLHHAVFSGHRKMVEYLYQETKTQLQDRQDLTDLLVALINANMFDIALEIIRGREDLATQKDRFEETALHAIAKNPGLLSKHVCRRSTCINLRCNFDERHKARELLQRIWGRVILKNEKEIIDVVGKGWTPIFVAVERGNLEFLRILIRSYPQLVIKTNDEGRTIFHAAVVHRQEEIFSLIHEIGSFKREVAVCIDKKGNNMLHLAAELAPSDRIEITPGATLQLQRELLWFKQVEKVVGPRLAQAKNILSKNPKTPRELFDIKHRNLIEKGEKLMRDTATSCTVVAILVTSVVFAITYSVPGGNDHDSGYPIFLGKVLFKIFSVAEATSLIFSASSVLTFLSVLTSTYAVDDFVRWLPTKLLIGLSTLFVAIVAMLVAFVTAFFIHFKQRRLLLKYAVPVAAVGFIPVFLFVCFHSRLLVGVIKFTCKCRCNSLFSPDSRNPLFPPLKRGDKRN